MLEKKKDINVASKFSPEETRKKNKKLFLFKKKSRKK